jgi:hypothetical protein
MSFRHPREDATSVPRFILPKTAFEDVKSFLRLDEEKLRALDGLFSTSASIAPRRPEFISKVSNALGLDITTTESVVLVCHFLLAVVEEGYPPEETLNDLREFVVQLATEQEKDVVAAALDQKRATLIFLLTPKPERIRARKVEYLAHGPYPTVDSFRTVCELRPVFESVEGQETIIGYVPTVILEAKISDMEGGSKTILLHLHAEVLRGLKNVVIRTEEKLEAIRVKFREQLLHDY